MSTPNTLACSTSSPNSHFPFLELPAELRNKIYSLSLANGVIKIVYPNQKHNSDVSGDYNRRYFCHRRRPQSRPLSLFLACKAIYRESHHFLYISNTFELYGTKVVPFLEARTPAQLCSMRALTVTVPMLWVYGGQDWRDDVWIFRDFMCHAPQRITGLEELRLNIKFFNPKTIVKSVLVKEVEAWNGRRLKVGEVTITPFRADEERPHQFEELAEELSGRLMASGT
ncbi:hypothetical protein MMC30_004261 [Trapelia coarctata]|nr:hypothetical protein [Trapelia coarctata]